MSSPDPGPATLGSTLVNFARGWDRFWFRPADPTTLCLIRLLAGLLALYVHVSYSWGLFDFIGPEGWYDDESASYVLQKQFTYAPGTEWSDPYQLVGEGNYYWSVFYHVRQRGPILAFHAFFLTAMLLFTLGLWTRYTSALAWAGAMSYVQRATITVYGMDTMMMILLFYLMIAPCGATLSLDRWLEKRRARRLGLPEPPVEPSVLANFVTRLIQVHFCVIYLAGGTSKLLGAAWWNATSLNLVLLNPSFAPLDTRLYRLAITALARHRWLWELFITGGVVYTLFVEIGFPFLVWDRRWRWVMVSASILLHTGIGLFMGLVAFSLFMLVMVLAFVPPEVVQQVLGRLAEAWQARRQERQAAGKKAGELVLVRS